eukprot:1136174-Pelagomonas_calceolata.AAC.1
MCLLSTVSPSVSANHKKADTTTVCSQYHSSAEVSFAHGPIICFFCDEKESTGATRVSSNDPVALSCFVEWGLDSPMSHLDD